VNSTMHWCEGEVGDLGAERLLGSGLSSCRWGALMTMGKAGSRGLSLDTHQKWTYTPFSESFSVHSSDGLSFPHSNEHFPTLII
jgi:hypothetical protein